MTHYAEHNMWRALFIVSDFPVRNAHCVTDDKVMYENALFLRCIQWRNDSAESCLSFYLALRLSRQ